MELIEKIKQTNKHVFGNRTFDFARLSTVRQSNLRCSIDQILVRVRLRSTTEPNRTIGVRLGSITERSIRYAGHTVNVFSFLPTFMVCSTQLTTYTLSII